MRNIARWPRRCLGPPEDRLAPGSILGDALSATVPAQLASPAPDAVPDSTSLTLVNLPPQDAAPASVIDPSVTYFTQTASTTDTLATVATAVAQPANTPVDPSLTDALFASPATSPSSATPAPSTTTPTIAPSGGGSSTSLATLAPAPAVPPPAPVVAPPPPVVPPPSGDSMMPPGGPTAVGDSYSTMSLGPLTVSASAGVLSNDYGGGGPLSAVLVSSTAHGSISLGADGSFTYTRNAGDTTTLDSFTYQAIAGGVASNTATVMLAYMGTPIGTPPTANADSYTVIGGALTVSSSAGVLSNDTNPTGQPMTAAFLSTPSHGALTLNQDGSFTYVAAPNYSGIDSFTYQAVAGGLTSNVATVTLNVVGTSPPTANADAYTVNGGALTVSASAGVLANDTNPTGQPMTASLVTSASNGMVMLNPDGSFTYTANPGSTASDSFTYTATAGGLTSNVATVTLNSPTPTANDDAYNLPTDGSPLVVSAATGVLANDVSPTGQPLTAVLVTQPQNGTVTLGSDGSFTYTATPGTSDFDSFTYTATAGGLTSNVATVTLNIVIPTPPTANDDAYNLPADGSPLVVSAAAGVLANDVNPTGQPLAIVLMSQPNNGTVALNSDGSFTYTANPGSTGNDGFTYEVTANGLTSNTATVTLNSSAPPPVANADAYTVTGGTLTIAAASGVLTNDTNPTGQPMTAALVDAPANGTLTLNPDGSFAYTADAGFAGADTFTYQATAGGLASNTATVALTVAAFPTANDDAYSLPSGGMPLIVPTTSGVLANDDVPSGQPFAAVPNTAPAHGTLALGADGSFTYTANIGYNGSDSFTYSFTSGGQTSNTATVTLLVGLVGVPDSYAVQHDTALQTDATDGVLANDSNVGGSAPTASLVTTTQHGMLGLNADGSFTYMPTAGYVGADSFTYQAQADGKSTGPVLVSIDVQDQAPDAPDDSYTVHAGQPVSGDLSQIATDPDDGDTITFVLDAGPANGQVQFAANGTFTYQANQGFVGTDTFTYHTNDGALNSPTSGIVMIDVTDEAPLAGDVSFDVAANGALNAPTNNMLSNTTDPDGDAVTARLVAGPANASQFALNADGTFVYVPAPNFVGTDTFTFVANDGTLDSAPATVTINVSAGAMAQDQYYVLPAAGGPLSVLVPEGLLNGAFNPTGYPITAVFEGPQPSSGTVVVNPDGSFVYTPAVGGAPQADVTFQYTIPLPGGGLGGGIANVLLVAAQPKVSLLSENFTDSIAGKPNGKVLAITADDDTKQYPTGWSATDANTRNPLALVAGDKYNLVDTFSIDKPQVVQAIKNKLTFLGTSTFLAPALLGLSPTVTLVGNTLTATWAGVPAPAKASVNDTVDQQWVILGIPSAILTVGNTAKHQIYVLAGEPTGDVKLYHTVVRIGTLAAQGLAAKTADDKLHVSEAIAQNFEARRLKSADLTTTISGYTIPTTLEYYGKWTVIQGAGSRTTATLVGTGDGNCNAWSNFFMDVVKAQGVTLGATASRFIKVDQNAPYDLTRFPLAGRVPVRDKDFFLPMFVKDWVVKAGAPASNLIRGGQVDLQNKQYLFVDSNNNLTANPNVNFGGSIPCQGGTPRPLAYFTDHQAVEISVVDARGNPTTILFDPSYGTASLGMDAAARLLAWQNESLDFVALVYPTGTRGVFELRMQAITAGTSVAYVRYFVPPVP